MATIRIMNGIYEELEVVYQPNGYDIIDEILNGSGFDDVYKDGAYEMSLEDAMWWERWAKAQALIDEAYDAAPERKQAAAEAIVCDLMPDMDAIMEAQLDLFGIEL